MVTTHKNAELGMVYYWFIIGYHKNPIIGLLLVTTKIYEDSKIFAVDKQAIWVKTPRKVRILLTKMWLLPCGTSQGI
jgi:hypothetical protein